MFRVLLDFAEKEGIDVMILGSRENKTMVQQMVPGTKKLSSTSDQFKARAKCPVLVIRPAVRPMDTLCSCSCLTGCLGASDPPWHWLQAARNEKMRIQSNFVSTTVANVQQQNAQVGTWAAAQMSAAAVRLSRHGGQGAEQHAQAQPVV